MIIAGATCVATWQRDAADPVSAPERFLWAAFSLYWLVMLGLYRSRDPRLMGAGVEEYRRVLRATLNIFGLITISSVLIKYPISRFTLGLLLCVGLLALWANRAVARAWLKRRRVRGDLIFNVVVLGGDAAALNLAENFSRDVALGYRVVGVCVPGYVGPPGGVIQVADRPIPILGSEESIITAVLESGADTVAVTATEHLGPDKMRELTWRLGELGVNLLVAPGIFDVDQTRVRIRPAGSVPLIHLAEPQYRGASRLHKVLFDRLGALLLLIAFSPVMLVCAVAVKINSPGPVFYSAERVGVNSRPFRMIKFRSMAVGADQMLAGLISQNDGAGPLFKMRNDPRVTTVGQVLRRTSLDELPQLFNVLLGEMSLVGPRPPLRHEVGEYSEIVMRRLLVKPGMTGLWQVSGRSDLPWDEAVRLDLSYVENWSMMSDISILWRTFRAVISSEGAY
ncbi:sugar transferase [Mycobacteroides abscessus]|nr:sugar transferase [Mycobacteroides abscessus]MDM1921292.1 sugar transferase [Mycobacteroides abscessus]